MGQGRAQACGRLDHIEGKEEFVEIFGLLPAWLEYRVIDWEVLVELDQFLAHFERCTASGLVKQHAQLVRLDRCPSLHISPRPLRTLGSA